MMPWQHWIVGQVDASIVAAVLLAVAIAARRVLSPRVRSALLMIALVRLVLPPWMRSPWSEAFVDLPPIDDTRLLVTGWLRDDAAVGLMAVTGLVTAGLLVRLACQSRNWSGHLATLAPPPARLQASVDRLADGAPIQLRVSADGEGPFATGLIRKTIVVPAALVERLDKDAVEAVLAHEVAHHSRGDLAWITAAAILKSVVWFNPLAHVIMRAIVAAREEGSDDWAITRTSVDPSAYAHALLQSARLVTLPPPPMAASAHPLGRRLKRLLDRRSTRDRRSSLLGLTAIVLAGAICLPGAHMPDLDASAAQDDAVIVIKRVLGERGFEEIRKR